MQLVDNNNVADILEYTIDCEYVDMIDYIRDLADWCYFLGSKDMVEVNPHILFGVVMKSLTGIVTPERVLDVADQVWDWANSKTKPEEVKEEPEHHEPPRQERNGFITEKQNARLWAIAKQNGFTDDGVHNLLLETHHLESTKEIPWQKYEGICKMLSDSENAAIWNRTDNEPY